MYWDYWWPVFLVEAVAIVTLNGITIATITRTSALRRRHNYLLVSIAVADFLVGAVSVTLYTAILGGICCTNFPHNWWAAQDTFFAIASMFGLASLSVERMCAITWPLKFQNTGKFPIYAIFVGVPWIFALVSAITHVSLAHDNVGDFYYSVVMVVISLIVIFISNVVIWINANAASLRQDQALERNLAITVSVVVMVSLVAWLPFVICNMIIVECKSCYSFDVMTHALIVTKLLHYGNSLVNPIAYVIRIKDFRKAALNLVACDSQTPMPPRDEMSLDTIAYS